MCMMDVICWFVLIFLIKIISEFALSKILPFRIDLQKAQDSQNDLSALFLSGGKSLFDVFISGIEMIHFFSYRSC